MSEIDPDRDLGLITLVDPASRPFAGAIVQDEYDINAPWHHHDMHQLQYAIEGSMELEDERERHLLPRSLAGWIPAGTRHRNSLHRIRSISVLLSAEAVEDAGAAVRILRVSPLMREMFVAAARWPLGGRLDDTGRAFFNAFAHLCREWISDQAPLTLPTTTDPVLAKALAQACDDRRAAPWRTRCASQGSPKGRCDDGASRNWGWAGTNTADAPAFSQRWPR